MTSCFSDTKTNIEIAELDTLCPRFVQKPAIYTFEYKDIKLEALLISFDINAFQPFFYQRLNIIYTPQLQKSVTKRQAEFLAGRLCVKLLMHRLLGYSTPVPISPDRSPSWPVGVTGSISHSNNHAIATLTQNQNKKTNISLGVDIQEIITSEQSDHIHTLISTPNEIALLQKNGLSLKCATTLLFSAKEAIYKSIYPHIKEIIGFNSVALIELNITEQKLTFSPSITLCKQFGISRNIYCQYRNTEDSNAIITFCIYQQ